MLYAVDMGGAVGLEEIALDSESDVTSIDHEDRRYIESTVSGCSDRKTEIDERIETMANGWKVDRISRVDLAILRLAIYELAFCEGIPPSVVIDEAVRLAKKYGAEKSGAFVNGVLGGYMRARTVENPQ
jgi:N utilization substance protein B